MSLKRLLIGEPMPDKNDPKYKERYERDVAAGRKFADATGISWLARKLQELGSAHRVAFLVIVFGIVIGCFLVNVYHFIRAVNDREPRATAVERVDAALEQRYHPDSNHQ